MLKYLLFIRFSGKNILSSISSECKRRKMSELEEFRIEGQELYRREGVLIQVIILISFFTLIASKERRGSMYVCRKIA